jgi:hypothetical protein
MVKNSLNHLAMLHQSVIYDLLISFGSRFVTIWVDTDSPRMYYSSWWQKQGVEYVLIIYRRFVWQDETENGFASPIINNQSPDYRTHGHTPEISNVGHPLHLKLSVSR